MGQGLLHSHHIACMRVDGAFRVQGLLNTISCLLTILHACYDAAALSFVFVPTIHAMVPDSLPVWGQA